MAARPKLGALDSPLARKPERPRAQPDPEPATEPAGDERPEMGADTPPAAASKSPKRTKSTPAARKTPAAPTAGVGEGRATVEVYSRIPEQVADRLDEAQFAIRKLSRAPRQLLVQGLVERHVGTSAAKLDAIAADVAAYRSEVAPSEQPLRALFVRMPSELADLLDEALFAMRKHPNAPTRQDVLGALIWLRLPEPSAAAELLQAA